MNTLAGAAPFWEKRGASELDARRLLVISYHFPPDTTIGARRWEKLAHAVTERGWGMDVITCAPSKPVGAALDSLPAGVRVYGVPDPVLPAERVEHVLWRAYRTVWPNKRLAASTTPASGAEASRSPNERPESIERDDIPPDDPHAARDHAHVLGVDRAHAREAMGTARGRARESDRGARRARRGRSHPRRRT